MRYHVKCTDGLFYVVASDPQIVSGPFTSSFDAFWRRNQLQAAQAANKAPQGLCG